MGRLTSGGPAASSISKPAGRVKVWPLRRTWCVLAGFCGSATAGQRAAAASRPLTKARRFMRRSPTGRRAGVGRTGTILPAGAGRGKEAAGRLPVVAASAGRPFPLRRADFPLARLRGGALSSPRASDPVDRHERAEAMLHLESTRGPRSCDGLTRRDFLRAGGLAVGLGLTGLARLEAAGAANPGQRACIQLLLVGGPGQLDTWDLKPHAPADVRGPFRPVRTNVPGISICEHFPLMARRADRFAILRSVHHKEAPIHETGQQLLQTGRLAPFGQEAPHCGAVLSKLQPAGDVPPWVLLPGPIGNTGVNVSHGQSAGWIGAGCQPLCDRYGWNTFGQSCLLARRLVQHGVRLVTVNMFDTVFNQITWDCHANGGDL